MMIFDAKAFAALIAVEVAALLNLHTDEVLDATQAGAFLGFHPNTVRLMASRGELPGRKYGDQWRFRKSALLNHITDNAPRGEPESLRLAGD